MAYTKEQLQKLTKLADSKWWFKSDEFKSYVDESQWSWAYDTLRWQLETQQTNLQQEPVQQPAQKPTQQEPQQQVQEQPTQQEPVQEPTQQQVETPIEQEERIRGEITTQQQPTQEPTQQEREVDFSQIQDVNQWKEQTWWWMTNLESWVENRYWTVAERKDNKLIADINWETFSWELDEAWNPIKQSLGKTWEVVSDDIKAVNDFQSLLATKPTRDEINSFILQNRDYVEQFKPALKTFFKTQDNIDFFNKYSTYNPEELFTAYTEWKVIVWSEKYNQLPEQLRQWFEEYKRLQEKADTWDAFSYTDMNNNVLSMNDILKEVNNMFSSNIAEEYNKKINSPEMETMKSNMTEKAEEIADLDNTIKNLEEDIKAKYPWITQWRLQALLRREQKELYRKRDDLVVDYNSLQSNYSMEMDEIKYGIELSKYEDSINRDNFMTALNIYNTERARMDQAEMLQFEAQNALLAEERQFAMQKELVLFNEKVNANKWWEYVDKWDGNLYYVKDWQVLSAIEWLGKNISSTSDDRYDYKIEEWENGTFVAFTIDKETNKISQQTFNIKWWQAGWYLATLWTGQVTSYGWIHDWWRWLDIDWEIWDPVYTPLAGRILKVEDYWDKDYGKSMLVQFDDWKRVRYSHLDQFNWLEVWDYTKDNITFDKWAILWTIWNTWYTIPWQWWDGSHLDIVVQNENWEMYNAYQVEDYFKTVWQTEAPADYYNENFTSLFKKYNNWELNTAEFKAVKEEFWDISEFGRQANIYWQKIDVQSALPQLDNYKEDLEFLLEQVEQTEWLRWAWWFDKIQMALGWLWFWDVWAVLDNIKNKTAFQELVRLKQNGATFGALSEKEFQNIWSSTEIGKLKLTAWADTWKTALNRLISDVDTARRKIINNNPFIDDINSDNIYEMSDTRVQDYLSQ